jgi:multidrug efflux pump
MPVASTFLQAAQDLRIGGRGGNAMYQYTLQSDNVQDLTKWGPILLKEMKRLPGFQDVSSDQQNGGLDEMMTYDRVTAAKLGLTVQSLDSDLYSAFGQSEVSGHLHAVKSVLRGIGSCSPVLAKPDGLKDIYFCTPTSNGAFRCSRWPRDKPTRLLWPSTIPDCSPRSRCRST